MHQKKIAFTGISSVAIHGGKQHNAEFSHLPPIYATSTFTFDNAEQGMERFAGIDKENIYSRWGNPTCKAAETTIAALEAFGLSDEKGEPLKLKALLHASGQAAMSTLFMSNLKAGDTLLSHFSLYGGSYELMHGVLANSGIKTIILDMRDLNKLEAQLRADDTIRLIHLETPANPTIQCVDIEEITRLAKRHGIIVSVDNTFATPYLQ